ncbi:glycosyl hydrolase family 18 protein [Vibrio cincinnatiensis]|uniref:glycosyl hydrolase family 18 protein n=1 Tax=Vibrio cincinnatiensis TaxID=675 RepID=UPI001EDF8DB9|nr:glycosyl hydrolase family 18 protein [Vibrio cincinnatiensis]MCG3732808.1 chitinase [Vibrio cincinnatiensis]MCG3739033.1 chitinase [Vibrio cincinnatiensis]MCG3741911.1 chitinase [Vibrio cincinnatiensis]MCG3758367.1 chitinase [Vibrio cincinnatiensis]MCG3761664.1 chitinase [Vibrio cincinnatiensis]
MNRMTLCAATITFVLSGAVMAAPAAPSIDIYGSNNLQFSKIELAMETTAGYKQMVKYHDQAPITLTFNQWSGETGHTYKVLFDGTEVASGPIKGSQTTASFTYDKGGRYQLEIAACDNHSCSTSAPTELIIADTDGSHLAPLTMNVDPNNKTYPLDPNTVVGTYFVEWGIYGRNYTVDNIPAQNLTHILYGFIPICGPNESVKSVGGNSYNALMTACQGVPDYEVVIHDPWAAYQKSFPQAGHQYSSPIKGNYAMLMALKQRYPDLKILPSVGGWTLSDPFYDFTTKANRDTFVASVKRFLQTWKFFDGVDIDWEFPGGDGAAPDLGDPINDGPAYIALMQELRLMLDELEAETGRYYELTSAIGVGHDKIEDVDYGQAVQYMDYIFAMTYDFYGGWNNVVGHQTALYCGNFMRPGQCDGTGLDENGKPYSGPAYTADNGIQLLLAQGVPANKLVLGTAMYGRGWEGVMPSSLTDPSDPMTGVGNGKLKGSTTQGVWEDGVIDYKGIKSYMLGANNSGINGFEYGYDAQAEAPWVWNRTTGELITFDDERSVKAKGAYVRSLGLAGLFSWEIDADNGDILNAMHEGLVGGVTPPVNRDPIANAGVAQIVIGPATVTLDGSASKDSDGTIVGYQWQQLSGPTVTLTNANSAQASFTIGEVTETEVLTFKLTVTDDEGAMGSATVQITVKATDGEVENTPPVASISAPSQVNAGDIVVIDASASSDVDQDTLTFSWALPAGINAHIQNDQVIFTAAEYTQDTILSFTVTVSDGQASVSATTSVVVSAVSSGDQCENLWDASAVYVGGNQVTWSGTVWEAKWWTQGDDPTQSGAWGVWKAVGIADCSTQ